MKKNKPALKNQFHFTDNIIIDTWGGDCIGVHVGENIKELCDHFCDYYKLPDNYRITSHTVQGTFVWVEEKHHQSYNLFIQFNFATDRVLIHECLHIVHRILKNKGMKLTDSSEEAYCYLLDYLFDKVQGIVKQAKIEFKKHKNESAKKAKEENT